MAKNTTKPAPKKPVTMAERVKRIEDTLSNMDEFLREATDKRVLAIDRRSVEHGKVLDSICRSLALDIGDRLKAHTERLERIESQLSLILSGQSFMQELEQAQPTKEQGLQQVEPERWRPKAGDMVVCIDAFPGVLLKGTCYEVLDTCEDYTSVMRSDTGKIGRFVHDRFRPATTEEVAKYRADIEAAKPIVPYETRVMHYGNEWRVVHGPNPDRYYTLMRVEETGCAVTRWAKRDQFTVLP